MQLNPKTVMKAQMAGPQMMFAKLKPDSMRTKVRVPVILCLAFAFAFGHNMIDMLHPAGKDGQAGATIHVTDTLGGDRGPDLRYRRQDAAREHGRRR